MAGEFGELVVCCEDVLELLPLGLVAGHEDVGALAVVELLEVLFLGLDVEDDAFLVLAVGLLGDLGQYVVLDGEDVVELEDGLVLLDLDEDVLGEQVLEDGLVVDVSELVELAVVPPT